VVLGFLFFAFLEEGANLRNRYPSGFVFILLLLWMQKQMFWLALDLLETRVLLGQEHILHIL
jgi:hypothetical protein